MDDFPQAEGCVWINFRIVHGSTHGSKQQQLEKQETKTPILQEKRVLGGHFWIFVVAIHHCIYCVECLQQTL